MQPRHNGGFNGVHGCFASHEVLVYPPFKEQRKWLS